MVDDGRGEGVDAASADQVFVLDDVTDPQERQGKGHLLTSVLGIAVLGCLCGYDDAEALQDWGRRRRTGASWRELDLTAASAP